MVKWGFVLFVYIQNINLLSLLYKEEIMAQTLPDVTIGNTWVSLNAISGIAVGTAFKVQNKSTTWVILQESSTQPVSTDSKGELVTDLFHTEPSKLIAAGSLEIWAKSTIDGRNAVLTVQTV